MELWEVNNKVHKKGLEIVKPGMRCSDVARELNEIYMEYDMLQYRVIGYGHSTGVLTHYYGRDWGLEFLEHVDTVLKPGMVITMEPMIVVPEGQPGAGGYREHDTLIITESGTENTTASFPIGPEQNIVKNWWYLQQRLVQTVSKGLTVSRKTANIFSLCVKVKTNKPHSRKNISRENII